MAGEIGYLTLAEAESYFSTRLFSTAWTGLAPASGDPVKTAALTTAFDRLFYCGLFSLPTLAAATADQLIVLKKAQCEMALYMLIHLADEDRRKGLHAQGVVGSNIVGETYVRFGTDSMQLGDIPIPPTVQHMLDAAGFSAPAPAPFYAVDIDRREDESVDTNVVGLDDNEY